MTDSYKTMGHFFSSYKNNHPVHSVITSGFLDLNQNKVSELSEIRKHCYNVI